MARVVIATKTSAWEWHGPTYEEQFEEGSLSQGDYTRIRTAHDEHHASVQKVCERFDQEKIDYRIVNVDDQDWSLDEDTSVVVTLGGDGTLLSASHRVIGAGLVTLFGIRSSGTSVGFLCAGGTERLDELVASIRSGNFNVLEASRLIADIHGVDANRTIRSTVPALNDFLYSNANPAATTRYRLGLGDRQEDHKSSGMWLSTALGSTAGIYAAGGVVQPRADAHFQYVVRELYRAPGKNFYLVKGFFDPDRKSVTIENKCERAILAADGNHGVCEILWGERIVFRRARPVRIAI